jgi:hypothetical protein
MVFGVARGGESPWIDLVQATPQAGGPIGQRRHTPTEVGLQCDPVLVEPGGDSQALPLVNGLRAFVRPAPVRVDGADAV